jgi:hypothetical protein
MNFTIRLIGFVFFGILLNSCIVQNPKREACEVVETAVTNFLDIVIDNGDEPFYCVNRGLEQVLIVENIESKILNKKVTLQLAKTITGTSKHIAQLAVENEIIYSEFK